MERLQISYILQEIFKIQSGLSKRFDSRGKKLIKIRRIQSVQYLLQLTFEDFHKFGVWISTVLSFCDILAIPILLFILIYKRQRTGLSSTSTTILSFLLLTDIFYLLFLLTISLIYLTTDVDAKLEDQHLGYLLPVDTVYWTSSTLQGFLLCLLSTERLVAVFRPQKLMKYFNMRIMTATLTCATAFFLALHFGICYSKFKFTTSFKIGIEDWETFENCPNAAAYGLVIACVIRFAHSPFRYYNIHLALVRVIPLPALLICSLGMMVGLRRSRQTSGDRSLSIVVVILNAVFVALTLPHCALVANQLLTWSDSARLLPSASFLRMDIITVAIGNLQVLAALINSVVILFGLKQVRSAFQESVCECIRCCRRNPTVIMNESSNQQLQYDTLPQNTKDTYV